MQYGGSRSAWQTLAPGAEHRDQRGAAGQSRARRPPRRRSVRPFTFAVTTSGTAPVTLAETGTLPAGLTYTPGAVAGTGTIAGTPAAGTGGTYPITFTANNITGPPGATQAFSLFVAEPKISVAASSQPAELRGGGHAAHV